MKINGVKIFRIFFASLGVMLANGCFEKWNPDLQYAREKSKLDKDESVQSITDVRNAKANLENFKTILKRRIVPGINLQQLNEYLGLKYEVLATSTTNLGIWEKRAYKWSDLVAHEYGMTSKEYILCNKKVILLEAILNTSVVNTVDFFVF